jgi:putative methyltransferase
MGSRKVVLVELTQIANAFPLASAYMKNYAARHSAAAAEYQLEIRPFHVDVPVDQVIGTLRDEAADVYTFSCYCWNMKRVRQVVEALHQACPRATFLLGGPQVLTCAERYVRPEQENVLVCNGEGESTFRAFLDVHASSRPDYTAVPGLSFYRDAQLVTTAAAPQVELDSIPSPFLESPFADSTLFTHYLWETNRGCPFHCTFCLWGQLQDSVSTFDLDRLKEEITWMARRQYLSMHICDANWGMLARDLELAEHIARCKREYGVPFIVTASHIKNQPDRVVAIAEVFAREGIRGCTTTALQSLHDETLVTIKRRNTTRGKLVSFEASLAARGLGSYAEVIWPLPEETLASFTRGLAQLAELRIGSVMCYPLMLLNNTEMSARREEHGFRVTWDPSDVKEIEWVVATRDVSEAERRRGIWFYLAFHLLYNARALYYTMHFLFEGHQVAYEDLLWRFAAALERDPGELGKLCRRIVVDSNPSLDGATYGLLLGHVLHSQREPFSRLLCQFCAEEAWWTDPEARALFEIDCLARPFPFSDQALVSGGEGILVGARERGFVVALPAPVQAWLRANREVGEVPAEGQLVFDHDREQLPRMARTVEQQAYYLQSLLEDMRSVVPRIGGVD